MQEFLLPRRTDLNIFRTPLLTRLFIFAKHSFPEHGASTMIRSKYSVNIPASVCGLSFVTITFFTPIRSIFSERIFARAG